MQPNKLPFWFGKRASFAALVAAAALGCSSSESTPKASGGRDASTDPVNPSDGGSDSSVTPEEDTGTPEPTKVALPFYVSDEFTASGFMADTPVNREGIKLSDEEANCKTPRPAGAGGDCYSVTWTATVAPSATSWAGVYWQSPADNWGAKAGRPIAPGAKKVTFYAAGAAGGEVLEVKVGGINSAGGDPTLTHRDKFNLNAPPITLTKDWTKYEIPLTGAQYEEVLGGFCWVAKATVSGATTFYIDDIRWE